MKGLTINGKQYPPTQDNQTLLFALAKAPVIGTAFHEGAPPSDKTVLILQSEYARLDSSSSIDYIGTKFAYSCVFVHLYTDKRSISFHVDHTRISLPEMLKEAGFTEKDSIKCVLIGGGTTDQSVITFGIIIEALKAASHTMNIEVVGQKILDANKPYAVDFKRHYFMLLEQNGAKVFEQVYGEKADPTKLPKCTSQDLIREIPMPASKEWKTILIAKLTLLATLVNYVNDAYEAQNYNRLKPFFNRSDFNKAFATQDEFYKGLRMLYSSQGVSLLEQNYAHGVTQFNQAASDFVINVKNPLDKIVIISPATPTPYEESRALLPIECGLKNSGYVLSYDINKYHPVQLSKELIEMASVVARFTTGRIIDLAGVSKAMASYKKWNISLSNERIFLFFYKWNARASHFSETYKTMQEHLGEDYQPSSVLYLNQFTGYAFKGYVKRGEALPVLDAVLPCETKAIADKMATELNTHALPASTCLFSGAHYVVVKDMNTENVSSAVANLKK